MATLILRSSRQESRGRAMSKSYSHRREAAAAASAGTIGPRSKRLWRCLFRPGMVAAIAALLLAPLEAFAQQALEKVTIAHIPEMNAAALYVALGKGYFTDEGIAVDLKRVNSS